LDFAKTVTKLEIKRENFLITEIIY